MLRLLDALRLRIRLRILVELGEDLRPLQRICRCRPSQRNRLPPRFGITLVNQLRNWNLREIRIAQKLRTIEECSLKRFACQVNALRRPAPLLREIVALENVQDLHQRDASRRWWRRTDYFIAAIAPANRLPLLHLVSRKVFGRYQSSALLHRSSQLARQVSVIKVIRILRDPLQRLRQFRLLEHITRLVEISIALKNVLRLRKQRQFLLVQVHRCAIVKHKPIACQPDRRLHHLSQLQLAPMLLRIRQPRHCSWDGNCLISDGAHVIDHVAVFVEIHIGRRLRGRLLAVVEEVHLAIGPPKQHEPAAANVSRLRMRDCERKSHGDCGIYRIAARLHDLHSGVRGIRLHRCHHRLGSMRRPHHVPCQGARAQGKRHDSVQDGLFQLHKKELGRMCRRPPDNSFQQRQHKHLRLAHALGRVKFDR